MRGTSGGLFLLGRESCHVITGVILCRTIWLFANEAKMVTEAMAPFDRGEIQGVDVHGVWVMDRVRSQQARVVIL